MLIVTFSNYPAISWLPILYGVGKHGQL
jgi:hypothetical protein